MLLLAFPSYVEMGSELASLLGICMRQCGIDRFPNQELHTAIPMHVAGEECLLLGTIAPPDEHLLATLLLSHTLKKEGARTVIALLPYLAYARDEKPKAGHSLATAPGSQHYCKPLVLMR